MREGLGQLSDFFVRLFSELRRSLLETVGLFNQGDDRLTGMLAGFLTQIIVSLLLLLLFWGAYWLLSRAMRAVVARSRISREAVSPLRMALRYALSLLALLSVMSQFGISPFVTTNVAQGALIAFVFYIGWLVLNRLLTNTAKRYRLDGSIEQLLRNVVSVVLMAFGVAAVLAQFGIQILSVIAGLGIVGIAVGFAAQETLSNFIAGVTLLVERPFRIGDWVEINGQTGKVREITLRTTRLRSRDNVVMAIPNSSVASSDIVNYSAGGPLRVRIPVGIAYKESAKRAREVMLPVIRANEMIMTRLGLGPTVLMSELGDSSVNLDIFYWIEPDHIDVQPRISAEILEACKEALDDAGIEIPFPHLQLFIDEAKGLKSLVEPLYTERVQGQA